MIWAISAEKNEDKVYHTMPTQHTTFYVSLWRRVYAWNVRLYFLYRQYTNLFILRFVFQHCLRRTLHFMFLSDEGPTLETLYFTVLSISAVHQTILYFDLYFNTVYAAHYTFVSQSLHRFRYLRVQHCGEFKNKKTQKKKQKLRHLYIDESNVVTIVCEQSARDHQMLKHIFHIARFPLFFPGNIFNSPWQNNRLIFPSNIPL